MDPFPTEMIGEAFSHYRVLEELGTGGMGVVYRAEDTTLRRGVALKFLSPAISRNRRAVERFLREARAAAALNHPNICTIYEAGEHGGQSYIAMEFLEGQSLQRYLAAGVPAVEHALEMAIQLADGLAAAHAKGIIHRDIKPGNIYVTHDGRVKILDFGLAKLRPGLGRIGESLEAADTVAFADTAQLTGDATVVGTVAYMSPEQARGEVLDARTDLFSYGVVLYEMCTGRPPFTGTTSAVVFNALLSHTPPSPSSLVPNLPPELEEIIVRALEKDPARRYQHASEIIRDLRLLRRRLESGRPFEGRPVTPAPIAPEALAEEARRSGAVAGASGMLPALRDYLERFPDVGGQQLTLQQYVWPAASVQDSMGQEISTEHVGHLLRTVLLEDPNAFVLLLGDYGSGKTSFMRMFGCELAADALAAPDNPVPIYINLGFARNRPDLLDAISAYVARYGVSISAVQLKDFLLKNRNAVLLLDGFDEMASWVDYRIVPEILEKIRDLQLAPGVRIVLSGRSSFFRSDIEVGIVGAGYIVRLRPFDDKSMLAYVSLRQPNFTSRAAALFERHANLRELCRNPIHLMLFVNWLGVADSPLRRSATASGDSGVGLPSAADLEDLSVVDLYQRFFMKTLQDNFGAVTRWPLDQRWAFVRRLACDWFKEGIFEWPLNEFYKRIETELPDLSRDEIDAYTLQLLNCTFFTRVGDRYRFLHQSYLEYLVSEALRDALWASDLSLWDTPLYTDIYEMTYQLLAAQGFERIPVNWIMETGSPRVQGNFLAMSWRHRPPAMEPHLRKQLRANPHDIVRFLAAMGLGLYAPSADNVECIQAAFPSERNTVVQAMIQRVASHWLSQGVQPERVRELHPVVDGHVALRTEDAERATLQREGSKKDDERVLFAFRRAMIQGDNLWTAAVGGMLALAVVHHSSSFSYIYAMAAAAKHPEIRNAYGVVREFTGLPELPK